MVKVKALMNFTLARFNEITNLKRIGSEEPGKLFTGDTFECSKDLADYLTGGNGKGVIAVEIIEIIPVDEITEEVVQAVASAIVEEAKEQNKVVETIVDEIIEETKPKKNKKSKNLKTIK